MNLPLKIKTIISGNEFKLKEKGSLFIAQCKAVYSEDEAIEFLNGIKKQYYDAAHNCYAYKLADGSLKYSDDGEPNGTAGIRILNAINHFELTYLIIVITRYFGGVKLGVGPLGKAYYETALECLKQTKVQTKTLHTKGIISYKFEHSSLVHRTLSKFSAVIENSLFGEEPSIVFLIPTQEVEALLTDLANSSNNKIKVEISDSFQYIP
jgi:uncharacterized YigZ family protein